MSQIMNYHQYPIHGTGSHSYNHTTYGTISADFGNTTYDWSAMPTYANGYNDALALLGFHCGVSIEMQYGVLMGVAHLQPTLLKHYKFILIIVQKQIIFQRVIIQNQIGRPFLNWK